MTACLGGAGSRRTVYLVDDNKIETSANNSPTPPPSQNANDMSPTTFLMFNKISTTIGDTSTPTPPMPQTNGTSEKTKDSNQKKKNDQKNRESAVWYEYGCV